MARSAAGSSGGSRFTRVQSALAHALIYVLLTGIALRVLSWLGLLVEVNLAVAVVLLGCWLATGFHRRQQYLCARCMDEVPADAPTMAQRRQLVLRMAHLSGSFTGLAIMTVLLAVPTFLPLRDDVTRLVAIPADLWLFAAIYSEWLHHRLRPWCPYCDRWDEDGDEEPSPDPITLDTKAN